MSSLVLTLTIVLIRPFFYPASAWIRVSVFHLTIYAGPDAV
jgi:hypothetical protein